MYILVIYIKKEVLFLHHEMAWVWWRHGCRLLGLLMRMTSLCAIEDTRRSLTDVYCNNIPDSAFISSYTPATDLL